VGGALGAIPATVVLAACGYRSGPPRAIARCGHNHGAHTEHNPTATRRGPTCCAGLVEDTQIENTRAEAIGANGNQIRPAASHLLRVDGTGWDAACRWYWPRERRYTHCSAHDLDVRPTTSPPRDTRHAYFATRRHSVPGALPSTPMQWRGGVLRAIQRHSTTRRTG